MSDTDNSEQKKEEISADEKLKEELEKLKSEMLYLQADFDNYKKRILKEKSDLMKYGAEGLVRALLDLLDNFERAMSMEIKAENLKNFSDGIQMISAEFKNILNRFGVTEVPAMGQSFDPSLHEALGSEASDSHKPGTISKVFTKPYKLHDRLVRPGRVIIAEKPKDEKKTEE